MSIVLQSSGGGSITIQEPSTASNFTQALPASSGTLALTSDISSSAVIQVKSATTTSRGFQASGTATDFPGLTVDITPTSASNKILVIVNAWFCGDTPTGNYYLKLQRNGTNIGQGGGNDGTGYVGNAGHRTLADGQDPSNIQNGNFSFVDSPASTSTLTYKIQTQGNGGQFYYNQSGANNHFYMQSSITVMEVTP